MQSRSPGWELAGVGVVALVALVSVLDFWSVTLRFNREYPDLYGLEIHEQRLRAARDDLPVDAVIGFVSDLSFETLDGQTVFFATQYALAPRMVVANDSRYVENLVLGYYSQTVNAQAEAIKLGMSVRRDYGNGIVLFEREPGQ